MTSGKRQLLEPGRRRSWDDDTAGGGGIRGGSGGSRVGEDGVGPDAEEESADELAQKVEVPLPRVVHVKSGRGWHTRGPLPWVCGGSAMRCNNNCGSLRWLAQCMHGSRQEHSRSCSATNLNVSSTFGGGGDDDEMDQDDDDEDEEDDENRHGKRRGYSECRKISGGIRTCGPWQPTLSARPCRMLLVPQQSNKMCRPRPSTLATSMLLQLQLIATLDRVRWLTDSLTRALYTNEA